MILFVLYIKVLGVLIYDNSEVTMLSNKDFLRELGSSRANFYPADFHFHSIASYDLKEKVSKGIFSEEETDFLKILSGQSTSCLGSYEKYVIEKIPVEQYYELLLKRKRDVCTQLKLNDGDEWAMLAITDHNVFEYSTLLSKHAWGKRDTEKLIILPGVELEIETNADGEKFKIHILIIFEPNISCQDMYHQIKSSNNNKWDYGNALECNDIESFIDKLRNDKEYPAICIAAHVSSSKGIQYEAKKVFSTREADLARTQTQIENPETNAEKFELEESLKVLIEKETDDSISLKVLQIIGKCGFDALQVRGKRDEPHYQYLHRFLRGKGRSVSITCSDGHSLSDLFIVEDKEQEHTPLLKIDSRKFTMQSKDLFSEIKDKAIRYGETRISYGNKSNVGQWIEGIMIEKESQDCSKFWFGNNSKEHLIIPFSPNLNCMIGGRGSGKSAIIEMIEFTHKMDQFTNFKNKEADWYERASATLKGCKLTICWKLLNEPLLKKKALFRTFYFDANGKHNAGTYTNINGEEVLPSAIEGAKLINPTILRIHDIEVEAESKNLLRLYDRLSGLENDIINNDITSKIESLSHNRRLLVEKATNVNALCEDALPMREYGRRKKQYDEVNVEEIKILYEKIDALSDEKIEFSRFKSKWDEFINGLNLAEISENTKVFFDGLDLITTVNDQESKKPLNEWLLTKLLKKNDEGKTFSEILIEQFQIAVDKVGDISNQIESQLTIIDSNTRQEKDVLVQLGLPTGSTDRQVKKVAYEEACNSLGQYNVLLSEFKDLLKERDVLKSELKCLVDSRSQKRESASKIMSRELKENLNDKVLIIELDAQSQQNKDKLKWWLKNRFFWGGSKYTSEKIRELTKLSNISADNLREKLFMIEIDSEDFLSVEGNNASDGRILKSESGSYLLANSIWQRIDPEIASDGDYLNEFIEELPLPIKEGIISFRKDTSQKLNLDIVLELDEMINEDIPIIRLNDRPLETKIAKDISTLSPGQRCSAILPMLLLHGSQPLIIDQPEDNLDNRLIRQVIVNILNAIKLKRQVIVATHNPNIPVLGDSENVLTLKSVDDNSSSLVAQGTIDERIVIDQISKIMEGGREALQYRYSIYQEFWQEINKCD